MDTVGSELEIKQATLIDPLGITTDVKKARKAEANKRYYYRRLQRDPDAYRKDYHRRRCQTSVSSKTLSQ